MIKRKVKSQIGNQIPLEQGSNDLQLGVQYIVGKIFLRTIKYFFA
jgi:hypothetical protein